MSIHSIYINNIYVDKGPFRYYLITEGGGGGISQKIQMKMMRWKEGTRLKGNQMLQTICFVNTL